MWLVLGRWALGPNLPKHLSRALPAAARWDHCQHLPFSRALPWSQPLLLPQSRSSQPRCQSAVLRTSSLPNFPQNHPVCNGNPIKVLFAPQRQIQKVPPMAGTIQGTPCPQGWADQGRAPEDTPGWWVLAQLPVRAQRYPKCICFAAVPSLHI